jgi:HD superfamily phosphohydrolase
VNYGRYDLDKIIESAQSLEDPTTGETYLAYHEDCVYAIEEMLLARYHMHRQVYGHKTRKGIDLMLVRCMLLGVEEGILPKRVFCPPAVLDTEFVNDYMRFDDAEVTKSLCSAPDSSPAGSIMRALTRRRLVKQELRLDAVQAQAEFEGSLSAYVLSVDPNAQEQAITEAEARIASAAGVDPHWVFLHWENRASPLTLRYDVRRASREIYLVNDDGEGSLFHNRSEIFDRREQPAEPSVSLYLRPKDDRPLTATAYKRVRKAAMEGLAEIGLASAQV